MPMNLLQKKSTEIWQNILFTHNHDNDMALYGKEYGMIYLQKCGHL